MAASKDLVHKKPEASVSPRYEWNQDDESIIITVKTGWTYIHPDHVTIDKIGEKNIRISVRTEKHTFLIHLALLHEITTKFKVYAEPPDGLVNILLEKSQHGIKWKFLGKPLVGDNKFILSWRAESIWRSCTVRKVVPLNYNTKIFRILIPEGSRVPIPIGHHLQLKQRIDGVDLARNYTTVVPSMLPEKQDPDIAEGKVVYLIIKIYPDGAMTPYIGRLKKGDKVMICDSMGPFPLSRFDGVTHLICLAAGTGLTPLIRLIYHAIHERPIDNPSKVHLVFYNKTLADIFWMEEFDDLSERTSRFEVTHVLTEEPEYGGMKGRISKEHINQLINIKQIKEFVPQPSKDRLDIGQSQETSTSSTEQEPDKSSETDFCKPLICVCGTLGFVNTTKILLQQHGIKDEFIHIFQGD